MNFNHEPVLLEEVTEHLGKNFPPVKDRPFILVDGTTGGAGHSSALITSLLETHPGSSVEFIGFDQDPDALSYAKTRLELLLTNYTNRLKWSLVPDNFRNMSIHLTRLLGNAARIDCLLVDLGVSSHQLDTAQRGFSIRHDGPLDMRMNPLSERTALDLTKHADLDELTRIFRFYGEEPKARKLAQAIVTDREKGAFPYETTVEFARYVERVLNYGYSRTSPAYRIFQALRIAVNDELGSLQDLLRDVPEMMSPHGRAGIISFHSLEDRIVKTAFREWEAEPSIGCEFPRGGLTATPKEQSDNPRARSARLRVFCLGETRQSRRRQERALP